MSHVSSNMLQGLEVEEGIVWLPKSTLVYDNELYRP